MDEPISGSTDVHPDDAMEEEPIEDDLWRKFAYEQFMRDDNPEDSVYDDY